MRFIRALQAVCGIAGIFAAGAALGQVYPTSPSLLRYPVPQPSVGSQPAMAAPVQYGGPTMNVYPQAATSNYAIYPATPVQVPYGFQRATNYPAQSVWTQPTMAAPASQYYYAPYAGQQVPSPSYYPNTGLPRTAAAGPNQSVLNQGPAPAEAIRVPPVQMQMSPSDALGRSVAPGNEYYPETVAPGPGYPHAGSQLPGVTAQPGGCEPGYSAYGAWSPYAPGGNGFAPGAGSAMMGDPMGKGYPYGGGYYDPCAPPQYCYYPPCWFAGVYGLYMSRDHENQYMFSYDDAWESSQLTDSRDSNPGIMGGVEVRFGRFVNCGLNAIEAVYWGVIPDEGFTITRSSQVTGNLDGILNWDDLNYNGSTAELWVNGAVAHAVFRENEFHNVEVNLLQFNNGVLSSGWGNCGTCNPCAPCDPCGSGMPFGTGYRFSWLAGIRWFHFRDSLTFAADTIDATFTRAPEEIYYDIQTVNNLIGFQLGGRGQYGLTPQLSLDFGQKVGLFGNHTQHHSWIGGSAGTATVNNGPNAGRPFDVDAVKDDFSLLGEIYAGLSWNITPYWALSAGYRMVGVTGVALPTNQIYPDLRGLNDLENVDTNGSLILHGGYVGIEYGY